MNELRGKTVLITGASSGIGWATALAFAKQNAKLALAARRSDKLKELLEQVNQLGGEGFAVQCDVRKAAEVQGAVKATVSKWGRIDVLINNAGILESKAFQNQDLTTIENIFNTNVLGCVYAIHAVLPHMLWQKEGHIVNVSSIAGILGLPEMAAYCASKFALIGLTESLRREYYKTGITLTAFCPGVVDTPMASQFIKASDRPIKPKSAEQVAEKIVWATKRRAPEVVFGEAPGSVIKLAKFFPSITDRVVHAAYKRFKSK